MLPANAVPAAVDLTPAAESGRFADPARSALRDDVGQGMLATSPLAWWGILMRVRAAATALAFLAVSLIIGGCVLLDPPPYDFTGTSVRYQTGRATMTIDGEQIVLDRISTSSQLSAEFGPEVYWYNEEGWGLRLSGGGTGAFMPAMISIDRVRTTYWSAIDYGSGCRVTLSEADETGVKGSATCTGLRWSEMLRGGWEGEPYVEGEAPFDATVEFQAAPKTPGA